MCGYAFFTQAPNRINLLNSSLYSVELVSRIKHSGELRKIVGLASGRSFPFYFETAQTNYN